MLKKTTSNNANALTLPFREFLSPTAFELPEKLPEGDRAMGRTRRADGGGVQSGPLQGLG
jgi:hypothetical protein